MHKRIKLKRNSVNAYIHGLAGFEVYPKGYWIRDCEIIMFCGRFFGADKVAQSVGITGFVECLKSGKMD